MRIFYFVGVRVLVFQRVHLAGKGAHFLPNAAFGPGKTGLIKGIIKGSWSLNKPLIRPDFLGVGRGGIGEVILDFHDICC